MKTIYALYGLDEDEQDTATILALIDGEVARCSQSGDTLGSGEWMAAKIPFVELQNVEELFTQVLTTWASPVRVIDLPSTIEELLAKSIHFPNEQFAIAFARTVLTASSASVPLPADIEKLAYHKANDLKSIFSLNSVKMGCIPVLRMCFASTN